MTSSTSLLPEALYQPCDIGQFTFATTAELDDSQAIIGQTRALEAIRFGIGIQREGFNLFALGPNGTGKYTAVRQFLEQKAPAESTPDDWCYVNNFEQPHKPHALRLPPGQAIMLSQDMKHLVEDLFSILPAAFTSEEYQARKKAIASELKEKEAHVLDELRKEALKRNIALVQTPAGFAFAPIKDGEVMHPEEFLRLPVAEQQSLEAEIINLQDSLQKVMHQVPQWHQEMQTQFKQLNEEVATFAVTPTFHELRLAQLPFAQEVSYLAATPRKLDEARMTRQLQARAAQAQQQLMHTAEKKEVRWSFHVARGLVADELLDATPATDLLVLGRVSRPRALKPVLGLTAQVVVARATHSILLIPPGADLERPVLVLYDGSAGARRALILAGKLAQTTGRLRVLIWAADDDTAEQFRSDVVAQLAGFDVDLSYRRLHQDERLQLADIVKRSAVGLFVLAGGETEVPPEAIQVLLEACDLPVLVVR